MPGGKGGGRCAIPELYQRAIKKWERNFGGSSPTLDFSNGVRVRDIAIDTSTSPYSTWKCVDNTIGSPVWEKEYDVWRAPVPDGSATQIFVGKKTRSSQFTVVYVIAGGAYHQSGVMIVSHDGSSVTVDHEYGGLVPVHQMEVSGQVSGDDVNVLLDTTAGVGTALEIGYNIIGKVPV